MQEKPKQKPKPNFADKYKGAREQVKFTLVDKDGKETVIKR